MAENRVCVCLGMVGDAEVEIKLEVPFSQSRDSSNLKSSSLHFCLCLVI